MISNETKEQKFIRTIVDIIEQEAIDKHDPDNWIWTTKWLEKKIHIFLNQFLEKNVNIFLKQRLFRIIFQVTNERLNINIGPVASDPGWC